MSGVDRRQAPAVACYSPIDAQRLKRRQPVGVYGRWAVRALSSSRRDGGHRRARHEQVICQFGKIMGDDVMTSWRPPMFGPESDFTSMVRPFEQWAGVEVRSPRRV